MVRLLCILFIGLVFEAIGVVFLSRGLREIGEPARMSLTELVNLIGRGATNRKLIAGVGMEAIFFGCLLYLISQAQVSFIWPLTALSFVATTLAAKYCLNEHVSGLRWLGVILILAGAALISYTERSAPSNDPEIQTRENGHGY